MSVALGAVRMGMRLLEAATPGTAGAVAERLFFTPQRRRPAAPHRAFLATGLPVALRVEGRRVAAWSWGSGPTIALVHGWGSHAARWRAYVRRLVDLGFRAVAFDAPGHGRSECRMSSMPEFARALTALAGQVGGVDGIIAHSLGGAATALALHGGLVAERVAMVAPAADPASYAVGFQRMLGLREASMRLLRTRSERRLRFSWDDLHVPTMARGMRASLLVVHDLQDRTTPHAEGAAIAAAWPAARLVTTDGLGHHDILRDAGVMEQVIGHVTGP